MTRNVLVRKAPGLPSVGHLGVVAVYVIVNIVLTFAHLSEQSSGIVSNLASRTGW